MNGIKFWASLLLGIGWLAASGLLLVRLKDLGTDSEWIRVAGFFLAGVGVAPLGLWLAHRRTVSLSSQTENEIARRVTDSFTKAVELLGHTEIAVRQGGIYALGRIAAENREEHPKIMSIIAAYIRHRSRAYVDSEYEKAKKAQFERNAQLKKDPLLGMTMLPYPVQTWSEFIKNSISRRPSPIDLEAAVAVIRDRNTKFDAKLSLDLSEAFLFRVDFGKALLKNVNFKHSVLQHCNFAEAELSGAEMGKANFTNSTFNNANILQSIVEETIFEGASMQRVNFDKMDMTCAIFHKADLTNAQFHNVKLFGTEFHNAAMTGAKFSHVLLKDVNFSEAKLDGARFDCVIAESAIFEQSILLYADLTGIKGLTVEHLKTARGNKYTKIRKGIERPADWLAEISRQADASEK